MNDFHATLVDWKAFRTAFESGGIGEKLNSAKEAGDHEEASNLASEFVNQWLWADDQQEEGYPVTLGFFRLGEVARIFGEIDVRLPEDARSALDAHAPFAGQWMKSESGTKRPRALPADMTFLAYGGLTSAVPPETCEQISAGLDSVAFKDALQEALKEKSQEDRDVMLAETDQLAALISDAARKHKGILFVFEI